jgi:uncharacterized protein YneF (UPF0154 family)
MMTLIEIFVVIVYLSLMVGMFAAGYYSGRKDAKDAIRYARDVVRSQQKQD